MNPGRQRPDLCWSTSRRLRPVSPVCGHSMHDLTCPQLPHSRATIRISNAPATTRASCTPCAPPLICCPLALAARTVLLGCVGFHLFKTAPGPYYALPGDAHCSFTYFSSCYQLLHPSDTARSQPPTCHRHASPCHTLSPDTDRPAPVSCSLCLHPAPHPLHFSCACIVLQPHRLP